ncbi:hypothetical protein D7M15_16615 [Streptomyces sp. Z26]|nr:hypothetical protein D7M15_16615 [Streptomyces sp. Z26]
MLTTRTTTKSTTPTSDLAEPELRPAHGMLPWAGDEGHHHVSTAAFHLGTGDAPGSVCGAIGAGRRSNATSACGYSTGAVTAAGLGDPGITPHELRHTAASLAIAAGADVKVVQTMMGHKSAVMTLDLYGHLWPDRLDEVADRLEEGRQLLLERRQVLSKFGGLLAGLRERRADEPQQEREEDEVSAAPMAIAA